MTMDREQYALGSERFGRVSRRGLLRAGGLGLTGAGAALLFGCGDDETKPLPSEPLPPPEVTHLRFTPSNDICIAPMYVAGLYLGEEGFTEVEYVKDATHIDDLGRLIDFNYDFASSIVLNANAGKKFKVLGGMHAACFELLVTRDDIATIADLRGKKIATDQQVDSGAPNFVSALLSYIGMPTDQALVFVKTGELAARLRSGEIDAALTVPPVGDLLRAANVRKVVLDSSTDKPFSQYYCCMLEASPQFVARNPVATKRVLRAVLRGADLCASDPERAARYLVDNGHTQWLTDELVQLSGMDRYNLTLATVRHLPYNVWRRFDPEDSLRFYALRMRDAGAVKVTPDELIRRVTDWRFFNELKREMPMAFAPSSSRFGLDCAIGPAERA